MTLTRHSYDNENYPSPPVYPFHRCCFDILCKAFDHEIGTPGGLVHRALYDLMDGLNGSMNAELGLIYDDAEGRTQTWMSVIGEEVIHEIQRITPPLS